MMWVRVSPKITCVARASLAPKEPEILGAEPFDRDRNGEEWHIYERGLTGESASIDERPIPSNPPSILRLTGPRLVRGRLLERKRSSLELRRIGRSRGSLERW